MRVFVHICDLIWMTAASRESTMWPGRGPRKHLMKVQYWLLHTCNIDQININRPIEDKTLKGHNT